MVRCPSSSNEKVTGHSPADRDDKTADPAWVYFAGEDGPVVAAEDGPGNHDEARLPRDDALDDEGHKREHVDGDAEERFEAVHLVDVEHAAERERRKHHDPHPADEIAAVDGNDEL